MLKRLAFLILAVLATPAGAVDVSPYAGLHLGWSDWRFERPDDRTSPHQQLTGYGAGAQIGVDALMPGGVVLGVVADITLGDLDSGIVRDGASITLDSAVSAFGTMRGKLGYRLGDLTPYLTGGAAWMRGSTSEHCPKGSLGGHCKRAGAYDENEDFSRWGVAYGAGAGYLISPDIELFGEWVRMDFGTEKHDLGPKSSDRKHSLDEIDTVKLGVNYRF
jgi:outer membrane immunogenic protein